MAATQWGNAGAFELQAWMIDSSGYPLGQLVDVENPVETTAYSAYRFRSFVGLELPTPSRSLATFFGGQRFLGQIDLGVQEFGTGNLTVSKIEEAFVTLIAGSTLDENTTAAWAQHSANENNPNLPALGLMGSTKVRLASSGLSWVHVVLPNVQVRPAPVSISTSDGQNPNNLVYELVPTLATRAVTARLFSATSMAVFNDETVSYVIRHNSRLSLTTHIKDATDASAGGTFITGYRPTNTTTASPNSFTNEGVTAVPTSIVLATGVVTFPAAGAAGDRYTVVYPTDFVAI